jgi:hypothetical protein
MKRNGSGDSPFEVYLVNLDPTVGSEIKKELMGD